MQTTAATLWSPTGGLSFVGFGVFLVWMLVTSILLTMKLREAPGQAPAPAASM